ncbi:hypothetical protein HYV70_01180 [Candidatus Uhrbacteria bacterium]|nr:hypothetical protein [Candidatus Uhrbacteria bacterium]
MNERREVVFSAPEAPEGSGLDAFLEIINKSVENRDESYRDFFKTVPDKERLAILQRLATHKDSFFRNFLGFVA